MARRRAVLLARLLLAALAAGAVHAQAPTSCRTYTSKGLIQPAIASLQDVIVVQDAFVLSQASVTLEVSHRRVGALKITLGAQPFTSDASAAYTHPTITLKSHGLGRRGDNMYRTTYSDTASAAFPVNASYAPFTGTFRPVQKLAFLTDGEQTVAGSGGSQGLWTLTIADVAPNNTLREIALNGWSLLLCPRGASSQPDGDLAPAPAPPVTGYDGPPEASTPPAPKAPPAPAPKTPTTTVGGWTIVVKGSEGQAGSPAGNPSPASPPGPPADLTQALQQLLAQRPMLTALQQQITALASGAGGQCDEACLQAKRNLWGAAVMGMYVRSAYKKHHPDGAHPAWLERLRDLLPGDNAALGKLSAWMDAHHADLQGLSSMLRDRLRLPALHVNGQPVTLGSGREGMQQLLSLVASGGKDSLQALMGAFAAAGDRFQQLASGLTSSAGNNLQSIMSALANIGANSGAGMPSLGAFTGLSGGGSALSSFLAAGTDKLAAAAAARQAKLSGAAGNMDAKLTALNSFFTGLQGSSVDEVTAASLAEVSDALRGLFDFSGIS